jgi:hypothetical protein
VLVNLTGSNQQIVVASPIVRYQGYSVRETSGSASGLIRVFDANTTPDGNSLILEEIALTQSQSAREFYSNSFFAVSKGIYVVVTGAVTGSIRYS